MAYFIRIAPSIPLAALLTACPGGGETTDTEAGTTGSGPTTEVTATTIPLPGDSSTGGGPTGPADSTDGGSSSTAAADSGSTTGAVDSGSSTAAAEESTSTGGVMAPYDVSWCILQYPPMVVVGVSEPFTVYVRFYAEGLTDQTGGNDPASELLVELGYGLDGSDPSTGMGAPWTFLPAIPNPGWGPGAPGYSPDNDEYQGDITIDMAGIYDYAARISGDDGMTWVYCDLDDLLNGGYTPDQAGHAEVGNVF